MATRPESIKKMAKKYPPGPYVIKDGAPYGVSSPGSKIELIGWTEDGKVIVVVLATEKNEAALMHEEILSMLHGKDPEDIHAQNVQVNIDPKWIN